MNLQILQAMALVAYGNEFFSKGFDIGNFWPNHNVFVYNNTVEFFQIDKFGKLSQKALSPNPVEWLKFLKQNQCKKLQIFHQSTKGIKLGEDFVPNRMLSGMIGGGGNWWLRTIFDNYFNEWFWKEEVNDQDNKNERIWKVTYASTLEKFPLDSVILENIQTNKKQLKEALNHIKNFANKNNKGDNWVKIFDTAIKTLEDQIDMPKFYTNLFPPNYLDKEEMQLFVAANSAWVFGGMGSWNDLGWFEDQKVQQEYDIVSQNLYESIISCCVGVVNNYPENIF